EPSLAVADDRTGADHATGHVADPRHLEDLADFGGAELHLFVLRLQHALEGRLDLLDRLVDDRVVADVHALALGEVAGPRLGPDVEADDHRVVVRDGQVDVVLGDRTDRAVQHPEFDLLADVDLEQRILEGLHRAGDVTLDDELELVDLALAHVLEELFKAAPATGPGHLGGTLARRPLLGYLPRHTI